MLIAGLILFAIAWLISLTVTAVAKRMAQRWGLMDAPGHRKVHTAVTPRNGGIGIFWGLALPMLGGAIALSFLHAQPPAAAEVTHRSFAELAWASPAVVQQWLAENLSGMLVHRKLALLLLATMFGIHIVGLIDDRKAMDPWPKLLAQLGIAGALVFFGDRMEPGSFRVLTALQTWWGWPGAILSGVISVLWIVALTNAFNFLDNMDGLSAGVAWISALMFLIAALQGGQWFIAVLLTIFMGSVLGFLCFNFPPASIFMGDGGSMVLGFFLSALTIRTTYYSRDTHHWYALFMPVIVLAVPLYDLIVVSVIRMARGKSPLVGDTNHFSHRLTRHGFSKRGAVLVIYAVTLATGISAPLLARSDGVQAILIAAQCVAMLVVIGILERVGEHTA